MQSIEQFDVPMSDALISIGATAKQNLAIVSICLAEIKKTDRRYNCEIRAKKVSGSCNFNGKARSPEMGLPPYRCNERMGSGRINVAMMRGT